MAKISIPGLTFRTLADGRTEAAYWVPSPTLRRAGWTSLPLGTDRKRAIELAEQRNDEVALWRGHGARPKAVKTFVAQATFAHLIARFEAEQMDGSAREARFEPPLADATKREYRSSFARLLIWAEDGRTPVAAITPGNVEKLKIALLGARNAGGAVKRHRAAAILRGLRMLLNFAHAKRMIVHNPMDGVKEPQPAARARIIAADAIVAIRAAALALDRPDVELGILLGLWTLQREGDILRYNRARWREITDVADADRRALAGADGRVMGFRLKPEKTKHSTGRWIDIPALPELRTRVDAAFLANAQRAVPLTVLVADPDELRGTPDWKFQRGFRAAVDRAIDQAVAAEDALLAEQLAGVQFRDLRRTGMCLMRELGLTVPYIASISGHSIDETTKILETYMPADTRTNAAAIAMLSIRLEQRAAAETPTALAKSRNGD